MEKRNARELFGVTEDFSNTCTIIALSIDDSDTLYAELLKASTTQEEQNYAMFVFGRIMERNVRLVEAE